MGFSIKGLISEATGGIFGNGKAPDPYQGGNTFDSQPDPLKWDANGASEDMANKYFGNAMDMRNGGIKKQALQQIGKLFSSSSNTGTDSPIEEGDI